MNNTASIALPPPPDFSLEVTPASTAAHPRPSWDEGPLATKVLLLVTAALIGGLLIGGVEARLGDRLWPAALGLFGAWLLLAAVGRRWIVAPYETLTHWLDMQSHGPVATGLRHLPIDRRDEVGKVSRAIHAICARAIREHHEVQHLRRTLDATVQAETTRATGQLRRMAMHDDLTELGNRRFLDEHLDSLIDAAVQTGTDVVCVAIDLDRFKEVNDAMGHAEGDKLLVLLGTLLRGCMRSNDLAVRLGGDEFVAVMPGASLQRGIDLADRVRSLFLQQVRHLSGDLKPNLSAGVASLVSDDCHSGAALLDRADRHLYAAKSAGRGVTIAPVVATDR